MDRFCCCSAITVATIALSATHAAAFPGLESEGKFDFKAQAEGLSEADNGDDGDKSFSNVDTTTVGGFSACAAKSWSGAAAGSVDSYAEAGMAYPLTTLPCDMQCHRGRIHCIVPRWLQAHCLLLWRREHVATISVCSKLLQSC